MSSKLNFKKHFKKRFKQRFHIELTKQQRGYIKAGIRKLRYPIIESQNRDRLLYLISDVLERPFIVVYSVRTKEFITVLYYYSSHYSHVDISRVIP